MESTSIQMVLEGGRSMSLSVLTYGGTMSAKGKESGADKDD
jgi:hypothetical protein